jgi:hypothetical protein
MAGVSARRGAAALQRVCPCWVMRNMSGIGHYPGARPGRDNATLTEPTPRHANCLTARRACARLPQGRQSHHPDRGARAVFGRFLPFAIYSQTDSPQECQSNENYHETKLFACQRDPPGLHIRHEYAPFRLPGPEPERKGRFHVFSGGKFCYQFYFVLKMENLPLFSRMSHAYVNFFH